MEQKKTDQNSNLDHNCIFCKIVKQEIPCYKIHENEKFLTFLDITPRNKGHCLVIPKKHYRWVWDIKEEYSQTTNLLANALKKAFDTNWVVSQVMGDQVPHAHIHLIPRFQSDNHGACINPEISKEFTKEQMQEFTELISNSIKLL